MHRAIMAKNSSGKQDIKPTKYLFFGGIGQMQLELNLILYKSVFNVRKIKF